MSNSLKIEKYNLSKKSASDLEHYIQLINVDIDIYKSQIKNYPEDRMEKCGIPFLNRLTNLLTKVEEALENTNE